MSRIRSIKPEWLDDERLVLASPEARVLSIALILLADDYGNGRASPVLLSGRVFPGKNLETLEKALEELRSLSFVHLYEAEGQHYFHIRSWSKHQKVDKPGNPKVPGPSGSLEKIPETAEKIRASRASLPFPSYPDPGPDPGGAGGTDLPAPPRPPANLADALELPVTERARALERGHLGDWLEPERWPEVSEVAKAWGARQLGAYARDSGVRAVVGCLADGFTVAELLRAIPRIRGSDWAKGKKLGMASMTPEVVRRALDESVNGQSKGEVFRNAR